MSRAVATGEQLFYNADQAAAKCGVAKSTLLEAVAAGRLKGKRSGVNGGGLYLFSREQLAEWFTKLEDA